MSIAVRHRDTCRLCGSRSLELVLPLAPTPIADDYVLAARRDEPQPCFPLDVGLCLDCGHAQLLDTVDPVALFANYTYQTSVSLGLVEHFGRLAARLIDKLPLGPGDFAFEIGSNDGSMLRFFRDRGLRTLGVDPAREIAARASATGIETLPQFFTAELGAELRHERGPADIVIANNVFAHADDLGGIADGIRSLLAPRGVFVFEVSYLVDTVDKMLFDTVYHEHLCYHSVKPLRNFFRLHGLELIDVERIAAKGGAIRGTVQLAGGQRPIAPVVGELLQLEEERRLDRPETFRAFAARIDALKRELLALIDGRRAAGRGCAGFGASATVTTLLHHFDLGKRLDFLVDDNPVKQGTFSPGHHLPVLPSRALLERAPGDTVILAWAYADPIVRKNADYLARGGRFIIPLPAVRTLP